MSVPDGVRENFLEKMKLKGQGRAGSMRAPGEEFAGRRGWQGEKPCSEGVRHIQNENENPTRGQ